MSRTKKTIPKEFFKNSVKKENTDFYITSTKINNNKDFKNDTIWILLIFLIISDIL